MPETKPAKYPARWEADIVASDGATLHLRPILPSDADRLLNLQSRLSDQTIYLRFFSPMRSISPAMLDRLVNVDYKDRFALIAELGDRIVATARYDKLSAGDPMFGGSGSGKHSEVDAEVAFLVEDSQQGRGLGTIMLEHLAGAAREAGITRFVAETLPENARMLRVFREAGFEDEHTFSDGVIRVVFPIEPTEKSTATMYGRERHATAASMHRLLFPRTVAVVGASRRQQNLGHLMVRRLLDAGFSGSVYPVHPTAPAIAGVRAWSRVSEIPDRVDLAVIVTPTAAVHDVVSDCVAADVGGLIIASTGFAEHDEEGATAEQELVAEARRNGMRVIGPAAMGVINTDPDVLLNATPAPMPAEGRLGLATQSGGIGLAMLDEVHRRGLGVSTMVAAGNKADVSANDMLQYWDEDPATAIIGMYIESFGNPRVFSRVARRVSRRKPVVAVASHRALAGSDRPGVARPVSIQPGTAVDALFRQSGVIRTDTFEELLDVVEVVATQPLPAGRQVAVIGNVGGPATVAADACADAGLELASLSEATRARLAGLHLADIGRAEGSTAVVGLTHSAPPEDFGEAAKAVLADDGVDACIAVCSYPVHVWVDEVGKQLASALSDQPQTPLLACLIGRRGLVGENLPAFAFPEPAVQALGRVVTYADWLRRSPGVVTDIDEIDADAARRLVQKRLGPRGTTPPNRGWLTGRDTVDLLAKFGLQVPTTRWATTPEGAAAGAEEIGYPVAVKPDNGPLGPHARRSEVHLGLRDASAVKNAARSLGRSVIVQKMAVADFDLVAGLVQDPVFGPLVTLGPPRLLGKPTPPTGARTLPLTDVDASELIDSIFGPSRAPTGAAREAVASLLFRLGRLAEELPDVADVELDPILISEQGAAITDARIRIARFEPHPELALRRLV